MNDDSNTYQGESEPAQRELTFGEKAVGLSFNPSGNKTVEFIKRDFALAIDRLHALRSAESATADQIRMYSVAITELQTGQMWAVKAATWQF
ncbi:MAG: hypothetical protein J0H69_17015 [Burkholderiales bacterium]|nr:hypothetical protein [Burkholderiales bacterium]